MRGEVSASEHLLQHIANAANQLADSTDFANVAAPIAQHLRQAGLGASRPYPAGLCPGLSAPDRDRDKDQAGIRMLE